MRIPVLAEVGVVVLFGLFWFFWGLNSGDFVGTEGLRAIVVKEMVERDDGWMPTVHHRPYFRKLPLYAWTTRTLSDVLGRFDETVARLASAALGLLYMLTMYFAGRALIAPRAALPAAFLAGINWVVLDYGMRAELDMGVLVFTTLAVVLLGAAWRSEGARRALLLIGCYTAALAGTFWKAPHVLLTVWLVAVSLAWHDRRSEGSRRRRFLLHPAQIVASIACLTLLAVWFLAVSHATTTSRAGRFFAIELLMRVVPHSGEWVVGLLKAPIEFLAVSLPGCLLAGMWLFPSARTMFRRRHPQSSVFLLTWFLPVLAFLLFVPSKAPRYYFLLLGAVSLLGTVVWYHFVIRELPDEVDQWCRRCIAVLFAGGVVTGVAVVIVAGMMLLGVWQPSGIEGMFAPGLAIAAATVGGVLSIGGLKMIAKDRRHRIGASLVLVAVCMKPAQAVLYLPVRAATDSRRPTARAIDALVPTDDTIFVLSNKPNNDRAGEMADIGFYASHAVRWPVSIEAAAASTSRDNLYVLLRPPGRKRLAERFGSALQPLGEFERAGDSIFLMRIRRDVVMQR